MLMRIYVCRDAHTWIYNQHIPQGAWYGEDMHGWWFCTAHLPRVDGALQLYRFNGTRWVSHYELSNTVRAICGWADRHNLWHTKNKWYKVEDKQNSLAAKQYNHTKQVENMMRHSRKHKSGGMGVRLDKENFYSDKTFTDYECRKVALNDFQRY